MTAIREKTIVKADGTVEIRNPAFRSGEEVDVIVLLPSGHSHIEPLGQPGCFFNIVGSLNLDGPPDWSAHLDDYLYHGKSSER